MKIMEATKEDELLDDVILSVSSKMFAEKHPVHNRVAYKVSFDCFLILFERV